jgi:hypothetical protein
MTLPNDKRSLTVAALLAQEQSRDRLGATERHYFD